MLENAWARLRAVWRPEMYHGYGKRSNFFEGWYFKCVDAPERHVYAFIPGVFYGRTPETSHCFVQVLEGLTGRSTYHRYPVEAFSASRQEFDIRVGPNRFRADHIWLDLHSADQNVQGELDLRGITPWPVRALSPGIMGWYAFVPFMECYHGVVSFDHAIEGTLTVDGERVDFSRGRGYIEKDWGQAFPQAWIWMQTNHFDEPGTCLTASVAKIPWLGSAFRGFIAGLWHAGRLYCFATYTGAKLESLRLTDRQVDWSLADRHYRLRLSALRSEAGLLYEPARQDMLQRISESLTAKIDVRLSTAPDDKEIWAGTGRHAGLEVNGQLDQIL